MLRSEKRLDVEAERKRLDRDLTLLERDIATVEGKLGNSAFVERAPAAVVEEHRQRHNRLLEQRTVLKQARDRLSG